MFYLLRPCWLMRGGADILSATRLHVVLTSISMNLIRMLLAGCPRSDALAMRMSIEGSR